MTITHIDVIPTLIKNTIMKKMIDKDGNAFAYLIQPINGYFIHDKAGDWIETDFETGEKTEKQAFYWGSCSCGASYDFNENPREFFAISREDFEENILKKEKGNVF